MRQRLVMTICLAMFEIAALGDQHPNLAKGFNPNGVYQVNGIDNINTFNGNLTLTIPIGQSYPIAAGLSYQLRLYSNGNLWDQETIYRPTEDPDDGDAVDGPYGFAYADRRANAGFGWNLTLGRLFPPHHPTNESPWWVYESPDGAEHHFFRTLHRDDPAEPDQNGASDGFDYTRDGTYMRMTLKLHGLGLEDDRRIIEFPDGTIHTFKRDPADLSETASWLLERISNRYSPNALGITYVNNDSDPEVDDWVLADGFRSHTIHFESYAVASEPRMLVDWVDVATFGGTVARYDFVYVQETLGRPDWHTDPNRFSTKTPNVQTLSQVLLPDGSSYDMQYVITTGHTGKSGLPIKLRLPTGGAISWDWGFYMFPDNSGELPSMKRPHGVVSRTLLDRNGVAIGSWDYDFQLDESWNSSPGPRELKYTITDPLGNKTESYFSVATFDTPGWQGIDYGLPFTRHVVDSGGRGLSQRVFAPGQSAPLRSTYLRYERDGGEISGDDRHNVRVVSTRTVFDDDPIGAIGRYLDTDYSDFDGLGHYRSIATSGTMTGGTTRATTTKYNPGRNSYPSLPPPFEFSLIPTESPWVTETFTTVTTRENGQTAISEYCFDGNGFLTKRRAIKDIVLGIRGANDLIAVFTPDTRGNLELEDYYGGDVQTVGVSGMTLCDAALGTRGYRIKHLYDKGTLMSSTHQTSSNQSVGFSSPDVDLDANTGSVSVSRDISGVTTAFLYDTMGRLTWVRPTGRAWNHYDYSTVPGVEIRAKQYPNGQTGGTTLTSSRFVLDALGRVIEEWVTMPDNTESRRVTTYNVLGLKATTTEMGQAATLPTTILSYDALGRVRFITVPDGTQTDFAYTGDRLKTRTSRIWTGGSVDTNVTTTEEYDGYGRLVKVAEKSGPTTATSVVGANVTTEYTHDVGGRLSSVKMSGDEGVVQNRLFDYDGRGFLRWESHPESGMTAYTYDARGLLLTKTQGAANSPFDLKYFYDSAGRLVRVEGRNPWYPAGPAQPEFRPMKEFSYAAENVLSPADKRKGKLLTATRYNYAPTDESPGGIGNYLTLLYKVAETYKYQDSAGRRTDRKTLITKSDPSPGSPDQTVRELDTTIAYNDLDLPSLIKYPLCNEEAIPCGAPAGSASLDLAPTYSQGRVTSVPGYVNGVTYSPNGMRNVLTHSNGVADTQSVHVSGMARPGVISSALHNSCTPPIFSVQPVGGTKTGSDPVILGATMTMAGSAPFTYQWYDLTANEEIPGAISSTYAASPSATNQYFVMVWNSCRPQSVGNEPARSSTVTVTVGACKPPTASPTWETSVSGNQVGHRNPDGSWTFEMAGDGTEPLTFKWYRMPANVEIGTGPKITVNPIATTAYELRVTNSCGTAVYGVTATVALPMTPGLTATKHATLNRIDVTWPLSAGAARYEVERRVVGSGWVPVAQVTSPSYNDTNITASATYAYRVYATSSSGGSRSSFSNSDIATTITFGPVAEGTVVTAVPFNEMLQAVNAVRAMAGWAPVTWSNILSANEPVPAPSVVVLSTHVSSCRARMNEALQALGVPVNGYTDPDLKQKPMKAVHVREVQERIR